MSEEQARAATPPEELERRVMDVNIAKSETEWWAKNQIERLRRVIEKDRSDIAVILGKIKSAVGGRAWMRETRGSYSYDDERFMAEFGAALEEIETAVEPLHRIAADWSDCPTEKREIAEARATIRPTTDTERDKDKKALQYILLRAQVATADDAEDALTWIYHTARNRLIKEESTK